MLQRRTRIRGIALELHPLRCVHRPAAAERHLDVLARACAPPRLRGEDVARLVQAHQEVINACADELFERLRPAERHRGGRMLRVLRERQCSVSTIDGAYCKRHTTFIANKKKDAVMAKNKVTMAEDKDTIATLKRELEIAAAQARQAARDFEVLALEKMMIEKFDEMMGKLDEMNVSSASK
ncbi:hypothetical protein T492DRAFT_379696 [Pavlovales sp. CCMP2436]|nr:hypothetical protein T492DRAFT_379696 [Pavlovales sp. CCMP2436]